MNLKKFEIGICDTNVKPLMEYKEYIDSFFTGLSIFSEARNSYILLDHFEKFLEDCEDVPVWITMNAPHLPGDAEKLMHNLMSYHRMYKFAGYIVTNTITAEVLKTNNIPVKISTVNDIRSIREIQWYIENGFKDIVLSYRASRNLNFINAVSELYPDIQLTVLANELCQSDCPFRFGHLLAASMVSKHQFVCDTNGVKDKKWALKTLQNCFIPPENVPYYPENVIFKLATRRLFDYRFNIDSIIDILLKYAGVRPYDDIMDLMNHHILDTERLPSMKVDKRIFKTWLTCNNECHKCNVCENELNRMIKDKDIIL